MNIMLSLGGFQFSLNTAAYQELVRSTAYRWASHDRLAQPAAKQFTGPGDDSMSLTGVIYPEWRSTRFQLDNLRSLAARGQPLLLVSGVGAVLGRWVIDKIDERQNIFAGYGIARKQGFTISIQYFDAGQQAGLLDALESLLNFFDPEATNALEIAKYDADGVLQSTTSAAGTAIGSLNTAMDGLKAVAETTSAIVLPVMNTVNNGIRMAANVRETAQQLKNSLKNINDLKTLGAQLYNISSTVATAANAGTIASRAATDLLGTITQASDPETWKAVSTAVSASGTLATGMGRSFGSLIDTARSFE
ncbi:phage tail protein [Oxalobacter vibrioformis]|uniref:Phage tail protein n=1 Tax=Oxalobacter vibrioformis TaxID=933080 RepID=A0A9E9LTC2_9BURK|nr:phage tail protein [Oxalobacter vibrioformis]WAW09275.1 phage tail protein [Oxalobacter vibrioformis]